MPKVGVIAVGQSAFVRAYPGSIRELAFEAFKDALKGSGIKTEQVDASIICSAPEYDKQRNPRRVGRRIFGPESSTDILRGKRMFVEFEWIEDCVRSHSLGSS